MNVALVVEEALSGGKIPVALFAMALLVLVGAGLILGMRRMRSGMRRP
jgi:hypothetical protein